MLYLFGLSGNPPSLARHLESLTTSKQDEKDKEEADGGSPKNGDLESTKDGKSLLACRACTPVDRFKESFLPFRNQVA